MNELIQDIEEKNIESLRNKLISTLQCDLNGNSGDVDQILEQINLSDSDLWQSLNGELDENNYSEEYLNEQMAELSYNFAKERFELCQKIGKELFPIVTDEVELEVSSKDGSKEELSVGSSPKKWILLLAMIVLVGVIMMMLSPKNEKQVMNLENTVMNN